MNELDTAVVPTPAAARPEPRTWSVAPVDVRERNGDLRLQLDVPGVRADDLEVTFEDGLLTIRGARADHPERGWHRALRLADGYDAAALTATLRHGVLTVEVPRAASARPRRVPVTAG